MRKCKILDVFTGEFFDFEMEYIRCGDIFMLYESEGDVVKDKYGRCVFTAIEDAKTLIFNNNVSVKIDESNVKDN